MGTFDNGIVTLSKLIFQICRVEDMDIQIFNLGVCLKYENIGWHRWHTVIKDRNMYEE